VAWTVSLLFVMTKQETFGASVIVLLDYLQVKGFPALQQNLSQSIVFTSSQMTESRRFGCMLGTHPVE
jgi:hypothetical protein